MRISFSSEPHGIEIQRYAIDNLNGNVVRITTSEDSPYRPGESFDAVVRQSDWGGPSSSMNIREYDRTTRQNTTGAVNVYVDRIHVY